MCGIFAIFSARGQAKENAKKKYNYSTVEQTLRDVANYCSKKQRHRGPDYTRFAEMENDGVIILHEGLSIIKLQSGNKPNQPFKSEDGSVTVVANGEIYNYVDMAKIISKTRPCYIPTSDCNVLVELYEDFGEGLFQLIRGMYGFILYDQKKKHIIVGRDPYGLLPVYIGKDDIGNIWVASEMKSLANVCSKIKLLPGGCMLSGTVDKLETKKYFFPAWMMAPMSNPTDIPLLQSLLIAAVESHMQANDEFGFLLSGGFSSSLIASIITRLKREKNPKFRLKTFTVGLPDSCDLKYSRIVSKYIHSDHTEIIVTTENALDCVNDVVYALETYDENVIRSAVPMFLLCRIIKSHGIRMVISGDGADDVFGGASYDCNAPSVEEFHKELVRRLRTIHCSTGMSFGKTSLAWGMELRAPFLDTDFSNFVMSIKPDEKIPGFKNTFGQQWEPKKYDTKSKYILRCAFIDGYLPNEVLWRNKMAIPESFGMSWARALCAYAHSHITDEQMQWAEDAYERNPPKTKEALYYRKLFDDSFPCKCCARTITPLVARTDWKKGNIPA